MDYSYYYNRTIDRIVELKNKKASLLDESRIWFIDRLIADNEALLNKLKEKIKRH